MKLLDRLGNEIKLGDKIAWVATSYGNAYLKIGNVVSIDLNFITSRKDSKYNEETRRWVETGKTMNIYEVIVKADILNPKNLDKRYIACMPERLYEIEGEEGVCKVNRAEKI